MAYFFTFFWFILTAKSILFWVYLWQLKEYHIGRFVDHFRTEKGRKIIVNRLFLIKLLIFIGLIVVSKEASLGQNLLIHAALIIFLVEAVFFSLRVLRKKIKAPVLTKKTSVILSTGFSLQLLILSFLFGLNFPFLQIVKILLGLNILMPLLCSLMILSFQPLTVALRDQLIRQAKEKRGNFKNVLVVGITGSYGKTSVKEFLSTILSEKYKVLKTREHQNSEVGISRCVINELNQEHEIFVVEMGAYNKGGIKLLCDIVKPKIGIITGVNEQHLATFGNLENLFSAEGGGELIQSLPEDGLIIFDYDNPLIKERKIEHYNAKLKNIKSFSMANGGEVDLTVNDIKTEKESISFKISSKEKKEEIFNLNLLGAHNINNILAAVCCAKNLGMTLEEIAKACLKIERWQSGMQLKSGVNGLNIIDATYSANPTGVMAHLEYLKVWPGKKVIVMPCLIELGEASERVHRKIGERIAEVCDPPGDASRPYGAGLAIITTRDRFKEIKEGFITGGGREENLLFVENPKEIFEKIRDLCGKEGDIVLLESRMPDNLIDRLIP